MRLLIYGAGVIGSLYGMLFSKAVFDVSVFARWERLESLNSKGILYDEKNQLKKAEIKVISQLVPDDKYDFIF